jgi:hypothetical protein
VQAAGIMLAIFTARLAGGSKDNACAPSIRKEVKIMPQANQQKCHKCGKTFPSQRELNEHEKQCK